MGGNQLPWIGRFWDDCAGETGFMNVGVSAVQDKRDAAFVEALADNRALA